jgi:hypothetical protein
LITTLISHDGLATLGIGTRQTCLVVQPLYVRLYIDHDIDQSRRPRHTRHRHTAAVLWLFSRSTLGFTLITTLISQDGLATLGVVTRQMCLGLFSLSTLGFTLITTLIIHDGLATLGIGTRQLCFGCSASLRLALHDHDIDQSRRPRHTRSPHGSCALGVQPLYGRPYIDHDMDQSRRPRHTRHRHTADVLWSFSLSMVGFALITTLISHDGLATLGVGIRQLCFGCSASLLSALHRSRRPRHTRHRHMAAVLWWFSLSTLGVTLITTLISHDGLATLGIGTRQLCFGYSASLRSALH